MLFGSMGGRISLGVFMVGEREDKTYVAGGQCLVEKTQKKKSVDNQREKKKKTR